MHVGIDPGKLGAVAVIYDNCETVEPMPLMADGRVDALRLRSSLYFGHSVKVAVESVNSFGMGRQSAFVFGQGFGAILATLDCYGIPYQLVRPQRWQKDLGTAGGDPKANALAYAQRMFPSVEWPKNKAKASGFADALCLADWCRRFG